MSHRVGQKSVKKVYHIINIVPNTTKCYCSTGLKKDYLIADKLMVPQH